jgi:hypothetical protein
MVFNDTVANTGQGNISNSGYGISLGTNNLTLDTGTAGNNASDLVLIDVPTTNAPAEWGGYNEARDERAEWIDADAVACEAR